MVLIRRIFHKDPRKKSTQERAERNFVLKNGRSGCLICRFYRLSYYSKTSKTVQYGFFNIQNVRSSILVLTFHST
jgi:hypothetical protein